MLWYLIKYNKDLYTVERTFTQVSSAQEYKVTLDKRNTSASKYFVECSPKGPQYLDMIVRARLEQFKINPQKQTERAA